MRRFRLQSALTRFVADGKDEHFRALEDVPHVGFCWPDHDGFKALFDDMVARCEAHRAGTLTGREAARELFAMLDAADFVPKHLGFAEQLAAGPRHQGRALEHQDRAASVAHRIERVQRLPEASAGLGEVALDHGEHRPQGCVAHDGQPLAFRQRKELAAMLLDEQLADGFQIVARIEAFGELADVLTERFAIAEIG